MKKLFFIMLLCTTLLTSCMTPSMKVEQTNGELNISVYEFSEIMIPLTNAYEKKYPDVKLNINVIGQDEMDYEQYADKISSEIMAGKGPDIISIKDHIIPSKRADINKIMKNGVFEDLAPYFDEQGFDFSKYNEVIMDAGKMAEKRYIFPTLYDFRILLSTKNMLEKSGFDISKNTDFYSFLEEGQKVLDQGEYLLLNVPGRSQSYLAYSGIGKIDFTNNKFVIDKTEAKKAADAYKSLYLYEKPFVKKELSQAFSTDNALSREEVVFENTLGPFAMLFYYLENLNIVSQEAVISGMYDVNGNIVAEVTDGYAINAKSPNKQNAANFIKLAVSEEWLNNPLNYFMLQCPTNQNSFEYWIDQYQDGEYLTGEKLGFSEDFVQEYKDLISKIGSAHIRKDWALVYNEAMVPYYEGETNFDTAYDNALKKIQIYIEE